MHLSIYLTIYPSWDTVSWHTHVALFILFIYLSIYSSFSIYVAIYPSFYLSILRHCVLAFTRGIFWISIYLSIHLSSTQVGSEPYFSIILITIFLLYWQPCYQQSFFLNWQPCVIFILATMFPFILATMFVLK